MIFLPTTLLNSNWVEVLLLAIGLSLLAAICLKRLSALCGEQPNYWPLIIITHSWTVSHGLLSSAEESTVLLTNQVQDLNGGHIIRGSISLALPISVW